MTNRPFELASKEDSDRLEFKLLGLSKDLEAHSSPMSGLPNTEQLRGGSPIDLIRLDVLESGDKSIFESLRGKRVGRRKSDQRARGW